LKDGIEIPSVHGINWLRVLGGTERTQIDQRVGHEFHAVMPTLLVLKPQQQPHRHSQSLNGTLHKAVGITQCAWFLPRQNAIGLAALQVLLCECDSEYG
jgi:hypothetical protein